MVTARANYWMKPHYSFANHPAIDVLIVVGGVHTAELNKQPVLDWISQQAKQAKWVASVCTGAFLLAEAKVLTDQTVTTHWQDIADLQHAYPSLQVVENQRWVDQGKWITSGGISAGIDMSLYLVSKIHDLALAEKTAKQMEFDWTKNTSD
jgi:transcriptional regulator GlxA family with amidase domain